MYKRNVCLTAEQTAAEAPDREDRDMHLLARNKESLVDAVVKALPERIDIMANIAARKESADDNNGGRFGRT